MDSANNNGSVFQKRFKELVGDTARQEEIAKRIGTSRQNVGNWLSGKAKPDIYSLAAIAREYAVSTDWLLGLTDYQVNNGNIKAFCDETGLTEEAAFAIWALDTDIISELLTSSFIEPFISCLYDMRLQSEEWLKSIAEKDDLKLYLLEDDYIDLYKYRIHKIADEMIEKYDYRSTHQALFGKTKDKIKAAKNEVKKQRDEMWTVFRNSTPEEKQKLIEKWLCE